MKKRLSLILLLVAVTLSGVAQTIGEAFYIYRNDGQFNAFFRDEVLSIEYSNYDVDGVFYDEVVTQVVNTADSVYKIPLAAIDSVGFVQPETKYVKDVIRMEPLLPYIVSVDGLSITFSNSIPTSMMPRVGNILLLDNFDSDKLPNGFAGRAVECNGIQVVCDSVSFEDIYEQIVCYGNYTAINDETNRSMRLVPRRIGGGVSTSIGINGTIGSTGTGGYASINGKLGLDLRVTFNFGIGKPTYFDLSLAPQLGLTIQSGIKGNLSNNVLSNKVNLIAVPIPDTPFLLKLKAGPVLKFSAEASLTATTQTTLGYRFGVKYEDGAFTGYGQNTTKWFSIPDVEGHISGSIFAGVQTEFGIFSYGDIMSLSLTKEAGAEFVANLTEDLLSTDKYEELQKGKFDLNFRSSVGVSARAKFHKWVNASANWELLSGKLNINSWKLVPTFQKPTVTVNSSSKAMATVTPSEKLLFPVSIGLGVWDKDETLHDAQYCPMSYRVFENWGFTQFQTTFSGLTPNQEYTVKPLVKLLGMEIMASPCETFYTKDCPVTLSDFRVTNKQHEDNGFTHDGKQYDYCFDVAVTATLVDGAEEIVDWGYMYQDPFGNPPAQISLKNYGSSYTDTRWAYFRNEPKSTCTLYGYVKYVGSDEIVYGEPQDFPLEYGETSCPDSNHPHMIDLGLPSGTLWACCNVGASAPEEYGNYYAWGETQPKSVYNGVTYSYYTGQDTDGDGWIDENFSVVNIGSDIAGTSYDAATANWGAPWRMPSLAQIEELLNNTTDTWTTENGVYGQKFTSFNGGALFFPAAGNRWNSDLINAGSGGYCWSSTLYEGDPDGAYYLGFGSGNASWNYYFIRYYGQSVRPVR